MTREIPGATYRLQLRPGFGFDEVAEVADYLARLGITHLYLSPYLQAAPSSTHGYDVVDHSTVNAELGGEAAFDRMHAELSRLELGVIADVVPNHMHVGSERNAAWWDVLAHGRSSRYANWFDIDWAARDDRVLLGVLDGDVSDAISRGELVREGDRLCYHDRSFPLAPGTEHFADLRELAAAQHYELCDWRYGNRNLNYRRFFEIDDLAALRIEDEEVFFSTHRRHLDDLSTGRLSGLRIDHIDGLRDPAGYLKRLRAAAGENFYLVVEKITAPGETLPADWPVDGTTGYDMLNLITNSRIDPRSAEALTTTYHRFIGESVEVAEVAVTKKLFVQRFLMAADLNRQAHRLADVFVGLGWPADVDLLRVAISQTTAALDVYRTYVTPEGLLRDTDRERIQRSLDAARDRAAIDTDIFDRLEEVLTLRSGGDAGLDWVLRFQQYTGPVMAKGMEDTFFYAYNRFVAVNEVGGEPEDLGLGPDEFHRMASERAVTQAASMIATSTHDTKRSEDVRARLAVLSQFPEVWNEAVRRWSTMAAGHKVGGFPDRNAEYLLFQTLVGAWPLEPERTIAFMTKALREAKRHTSWHDPDTEKEAALEKFVLGVLSDPELTSDVSRFVERLAPGALVNSLAQVALKMTLPGVPDTYQGCEVIDLSLVDPDNRRPVDFARLRSMLEHLEQPSDPSGDDLDAAKLFLTNRLLQLRKAHRDAFAPGAAYQPLVVTGAHGDGVIAYLREERVAVVLPRWGIAPSDWGDTELVLPPGTWRNALSGDQDIEGAVDVGTVLAVFAVAVFERT